MPARSQIRIRRDLNRLKTLVDEHAQDNAALAAIADDVAASAGRVNVAFQNYQQVAVVATREREERDASVGRLHGWVQRWRPVVLLKIPGAAGNLRTLPSSGATPDDEVRLAEDLRDLMRKDPGAGPFREAALAALGDLIEAARKETAEATTALPAQDGARAALTEATLGGNAVLVRALDIVRAVFGARSPQYKQFVLRSASPADAQQEDQEAATGEEDAEPVPAA
jgi:hypothetical protein